MSVIYLLQIIELYENLQQAITQMGLDSSKYAYVYKYIEEFDSTRGPDTVSKNEGINDNNFIEDGKKPSVEALVAKGIDSVYFKVMLKKYIEETEINYSCIKGGMAGVHTYLSSFMVEGDDIDIVISYSLKIPVPIIALKEIPVLQRVRIRGFTGYNPMETEDSENSEEIDDSLVYITETGRVYHLTKACTYLKLSIQETTFKEISYKRNDSGGNYFPCSLCSDGSGHNPNEIVFITKTGDKYHKELNCSGLKRTILTINLSQIGDKTLCSRCSKSATKEKGVK